VNGISNRDESIFILASNRAINDHRSSLTTATIDSRDEDSSSWQDVNGD